MSNIEEIEKERYEQYLAEEKIIHDSLMSNDVELNRTMRYFSGVILILLTGYIEWDIKYKTFMILISYVPFVFSIIINIISYIFIQHGLYKRSEFNEEYYIKDMEESRLKVSKAGKIGGALIYISIFLFIIGILVISMLMVSGILEIKGGE